MRAVTSAAYAAVGEDNWDAFLPTLASEVLRVAEAIWKDSAQSDDIRELAEGCIYLADCVLAGGDAFDGYMLGDNLHRLVLATSRVPELVGSYSKSTTKGASALKNWRRSEQPEMVERRRGPVIDFMKGMLRGRRTSATDRDPTTDDIITAVMNMKQTLDDEGYPWSYKRTYLLKLLARARREVQAEQQRHQGRK